MVKYCCNNFHALKITFANETARVCEAMGVDPFEVMDLVCKDRQLNISPAYLKPGFAFGGSCLPKDLRATMHLAKMRDVDLPMLGGILASNRGHIDHAIAKVLASGERRIGMIGLSFKTGHRRPAGESARADGGALHRQGPVAVDLRSGSAPVAAARRQPAIHRAAPAPHRLHDPRRTSSRVIAESGLLVVGIAPPGVRDALERLVRPDQIVLDLVNLPNRAKLAGRYEGLCW